MIKKLLLFILVIFTCTIQGQIRVDDSSFTIEQLVEDVLIDSPCAIVENISSFTGTSSGFNGIGYFESNGSGFEIDKGIILSTGNARSAVGPNGTVALSEGNATAWGGDNDLGVITSTPNLFNATYLQFDFVPTIDFISFDFLFASEEYFGGFPCTFSDVFAFILTDSSGSSRNLAVVPGTNTAIKVTTVNEGVDLNNDGDYEDVIDGLSECPPQNENFYNRTIPPGGAAPIDFNGYTEVFTASGDVIIGERYTIKLVIAENRDGAFDSAVFLSAGSFKIGGDLGDDRTLASGNPGCIGTPIILDASAGSSVTYTWTRNGLPLVAGDGTTLLAGGAQLEVTLEGAYSVEVEIASGCTSTDSINIEFVAPPMVASVVSLLQCDDDTDGFSLFNLSEANSLISPNAANETFTYYLTEGQAIIGNTADQITNFTTYTNPIVQNSTVYARVTSPITNCFSISRIDLEVSTTQIPASFNLTYVICEANDSDPTDGIATFNFSNATNQILQLFPGGQNLTIQYYENEQDALSEENEIINVSNYRNDSSPFISNLYVRVENNVANSCLGLGEHITLIANPLDPIEFEDEYTSCLEGNGTQINLLPTDRIETGLNPLDYTFEWFTGTTPVSGNEIPGETGDSFLPSDEGIYSVLATSIISGCTLSKSTTVINSYPPEDITAEVLSGAFSNNATIEVTVVGNGEYEFRLDNRSWQESNIFTRVPRGEHIVYVRDLRMCGELEFNVGIIVDYPRYFTPNGDGFHDSWGIVGNTNVIISQILIFDRYGKLLKDLGARGNWDGTYNGNLLPASDYWFKVLYIEEGVSKVFNSNFSLIR
ncbi:T9SS type B sorting domain-containing protein [Aquimarina sp. AU474]|uniref:T9SS type B sorting domain-containing protein n=1 Tax=Aquimarina sp. AU474 TaxID=2108529 RepID=UPI000D69AF9D|nr:choice-of-anchor L domain-containing protein [Aquimarina sp. AU474]